MTKAAFDDVIHGPPRLQVCALLFAVAEAEYAALRDEVGVSDSVLSKHLRQLEAAGYARTRRAVTDGYRRAWVALTPAGRKAFAAHLAELKRLARIAETGRAWALPKPAV